MNRICLIAMMLLAGAVVGKGPESSVQKTDRLLGVLQSDAPIFEKARACQQLGEVGTARAVPALARLLEDEHLSAYARSGLEGIGTAQAAEALRSALPRLKGARRIGVVNSLGAMRDAGSVEALKALALEPSSGASAEALAALGRIANGPAVEVIRGVLAGNDPAQRVNAASACLLAAQRQLAEGNMEGAAELYDAVRTAEIPPIRRIGATRGAILARRGRAAPFLVEQLRSADRLVRNEALLTIRSMPSDELASALNAELGDAPAELRVQILAALADCHNAQSLEAIQKYTASDSAEVRRAAMAALGKIGGRDAAGALVKVMVSSRDSADLALAMSGLERMEDPAVDEMIARSAAAAAAPEGRVRLIRLVEAHAIGAAMPDLLKLATDGAAEVRVAAIQAMRALAGPGDLPALVALVRSAGDDGTRAAAEGAVVAVCRRAPEAGTGLVLAELEQAKEPKLRCAWIRVLVSLGDAKALPAVTAALNDGDAVVAAEAARGLGRWPDPAPVESLLAVAESSKDAGQRGRALGSAMQLLAVAAEKGQRPAGALAALFERAAKSASSAAEKRRLISGLGRLPHETSLRLLGALYEDASVRGEAAVAVVQIAPSLAKQSPTPALRKLLGRIAAGEAGDDLRKRAAEIARTLPK